MFKKYYVVFLMLLVPIISVSIISNIFDNINNKSVVSEPVKKEIKIEKESNEDSNKSKDLSGFTEIYRQQHCWEVIDGINIENKIKELQTEIEDFKTNIDYILSESNAITQIEIED